MTALGSQMTGGLAALLVTACALSEQSRATGNLQDDPAAAEAAISQAACGTGLPVLVGADQRTIGDLGMLTGYAVIRRDGVPFAKVSAGPGELKKLLATTAVTSVHPLSDKKMASKTSTTDGADIAAAFAKKGPKARVRVIADLAVERSSKTALPDKTDLARIKSVQADLTQSLKAFGVKDVKSFQFLPQMAFSVDHAAFVALETSALVCRLHLERPMRIQTVQ